MRVYLDRLASESWIVLALHDINHIPAVMTKLGMEEHFSLPGSELSLTHLSRNELIPVRPKWLTLRCCCSLHSSSFHWSIDQPFCQPAKALSELPAPLVLMHK